MRSKRAFRLRSSTGDPNGIERARPIGSFPTLPVSAQNDRKRAARYALAPFSVKALW